VSEVGDRQALSSPHPPAGLGRKLDWDEAFRRRLPTLSSHYLMLCQMQLLILFSAGYIGSGRQGRICRGAVRDSRLRCSQHSGVLLVYNEFNREFTLMFLLKNCNPHYFQFGGTIRVWSIRSARMQRLDYVSTSTLLVMSGPRLMMQFNGTHQINRGDSLRDAWLPQGL